MTDEEKAEQYADENKSVYQNTFVKYSDDYEEIKQAVLYGLAEGRKEQENKDKGFCESFCMKGGRIADLEKENAELRERLEFFNAAGNTVDKQTYNAVVNENEVLKKEIEKLRNHNLIVQKICFDSCL